MNINEAIAQLERAKELGETDIVFAYWKASALDMDGFADWPAVAEYVEEIMDWSSTHDKITDIIAEYLR